LLLLCAAYALLLLYAGTFYGALDWQGALLLHLLQAGGAVGAAVHLWRHPAAAAARWGKALPTAAGALLLWTALSPWMAPAARFTWEGILGLSGGIGWALLAAATLRNSANRRHAALFATLALATTALWSYAAYRNGTTVRPALPLGHHNFLASVLVMLLGPATALALPGRGSPPDNSSRAAAFTRWTARASALLALMALAGTSSLSGASGGATGIATGLLLWWRFLRPPRRPPARLAAAPLALLILTALVLLLTPGGARIYSRAGALLSGRALADTSVRNRIDYSHGALAGVFTERPWRGFGPGSVALRFPLYRVQRNEPEEIGKVVTQLHATPSHLLFESGLVGGALTLWLLLALALRSGRRLRHEAAQPATPRPPNGGAPPRTHPDLQLRLAAAAALAACLVAALGDFQLHIAAIPATIALLIGLLFGGAAPAPAASSGASLAASSAPSRATSPAPATPIRCLGLLLLLTAVAAAIRLIPIDRAHRHWDLALDTLDTQQPLKAAGHLHAAIALDPAFGFYQECMADLLQETAAAAAPGAPPSPLPYLLEAAATTPFAPLFAARAGTALLDAGEPAAALPWLRIATALEVASPLTWYHLGRAQIASGEKRAGLRSWAHALALEPALQSAAAFADPSAPNAAQGARLISRLARRGGAPAPTPPSRPWRANAYLETSHDADPWRSTAAFLFRRHGLPGTALGIPLDLRTLPLPQLTAADSSAAPLLHQLLPILPNRAIDWLCRHPGPLPAITTTPP
jgi:hypothetical protein